MENGPGMTMYFPTEFGDIPASHVSLREGDLLNSCRKGGDFQSFRIDAADFLRSMAKWPWGIR